MAVQTNPLTGDATRPAMEETPSLRTVVITNPTGDAPNLAMEETPSLRMVVITNLPMEEGPNPPTVDVTSLPMVDKTSLPTADRMNPMEANSKRPMAATIHRMLVLRFPMEAQPSSRTVGTNPHTVVEMNPAEAMENGPNPPDMVNKLKATVVAVTEVVMAAVMMKRDMVVVLLVKNMVVGEVNMVVEAVTAGVAMSTLGLLLPKNLKLPEAEGITPAMAGRATHLALNE